MPNKTLSWGEVTSVLSTVSKKQLIVAGDGQQLITRGEAAKLIIDAFGFNNEESGTTTTISISNGGNQNSDSSNKNALSSLWIDFQDMMKIS